MSSFRILDSVIYNWIPGKCPWALLLVNFLPELDTDPGVWLHLVEFHICPLSFACHGSCRSFRIPDYMYHTAEIHMCPWMELLLVDLEGASGSQNHYIYSWIPPDLSMELCLQILHEETQDPRLHTWTLNPRTQFIPQCAGASQLVDFALGVSGLTSMITCPNSQTEYYLPAAFELWNPIVETLVNLDSALHHGFSSSPEFKSIFIMLSRTLIKLPGSNQKIFPYCLWHSHLLPRHGSQQLPHS